MEPQPQAVRPNEAEQTATSSTTAEPQPQGASSAVAAQAGASATAAEQQPQVASSAVAAQADTSATTAGPQPQASSSMAAEYAETTAATAGPQPQVASSAEADQVHTIAEEAHDNILEKLLFKRVWAFFPGVIILWIVLLVIDLCAYEIIDKLGQVGDSFGTLNTLFSGLAFLGIIISIKYQRDDLKLQRKTLAMQLDEIISQRKAQEDQAKEVKLQREEMESQRRLAQEYQDERFFVLLLEQVKGTSVATSNESIKYAIKNCYNRSPYDYTIDKEKEYRDNLIKLIQISYTTPRQNNVQEALPAEISSFLDKICNVENGKYKLLSDRVIHVHELITSLPDENTRKNYARIVYTNIGPYDRIIVFMYLVAQFKIVSGDILGDLLFADYEKLNLR